MSVTVKVDRQGRLVIPQRERERLDVAEGGTLELVPTPEGILLERRRQAVVTTSADGLPVITVSGTESVSNEEALEGIHRHRDRT